MALISVIVPVYNTALYLRRCLDSLAAQTFSDLEILIVDDGSTDKSAQIADEYATAFDNFRVIHKANAGLPQARKTGVEASTGSYIGFVDSDDWIEPDMYQALMSLAETSKADIVCGGYWSDYPNGKSVPSDFSHKGQNVMFTAVEALQSLHKKDDIMPYMWNKVYRKELFDHILFPQGNPVGEDYVIQIQLLSKANKIVQMSQPLLHYVQQPNSMSRGGFTQERKKSFYLYQEWRNWILQKFPQLYREIVAYHLCEELAVLVSMGKNQVYDKNIITDITSDLRKNSGFFVQKYVPAPFKMAGFAAVIHGKLVCHFTTLLYNIRH